jgi:hypothetical protein
MCDKKYREEECHTDEEKLPKKEYRGDRQAIVNHPLMVCKGQRGYRLVDESGSSSLSLTLSSRLSLSPSRCLMLSLSRIFSPSSS